MIKDLNSYISDPDSHDRDRIAELLALEDFSPVYREADRVRREAVGDTVHIRAIIEFSNICSRQCIYCGLNCRNSELERFRMSKDEIVRSAKAAVDAGYRTIVLQSGEDRTYPVERLGEIVEAVKSIGSEPPAVTLSCGEMSHEDYEYLRQKGADRYLLKHETADPELYRKLHPCGTLKDRVKCLRDLKALGYETGSGFMIGLPGQTLETVADDLLLLKDIGCHMAGIGPFIANPKTPLAGARNGDPELTRRAVAIARLLLPHANLPVTTSLSVLSASGKNQKEHPPENSTGTAGIAVSPGSSKQRYSMSRTVQREMQVSQSSVESLEHTGRAAQQTAMIPDHRSAVRTTKMYTATYHETVAVTVIRRTASPGPARKDPILHRIPNFREKQKTRFHSAPMSS